MTLKALVDSTDHTHLEDETRAVTVAVEKDPWKEKETFNLVLTEGYHLKHTGKMAVTTFRIDLSDPHRVGELRSMARFLDRVADAIHPPAPRPSAEAAQSMRMPAEWIQCIAGDLGRGKTDWEFTSSGGNVMKVTKSRVEIGPAQGRDVLDFLWNPDD